MKQFNILMPLSTIVACLAIAAFCASAQTTTPTCPGSMTWDPTISWCSSSPICPTGTTYDVAHNWCGGVTPSCPAEMTWDGTYSHCSGGTPPCAAGQREFQAPGDNPVWTCSASPTCPSGQTVSTYEAAGTTLAICTTAPSCPAGQVGQMNGNKLCYASPVGNINGACGSANGVASVAVPRQNLCTMGTTASPGCDNMTSCQNWIWTCRGYNGGRDANCSAPRTITQQSITITSPGTGASWQAGGAYNITWTASGFGAGSRVGISLVSDSGLTAIIASGVPTLWGSYSWTIPSGQALGNHYSIQILTDNSTGLAGAGSTGYFSITPGMLTCAASAVASRETAIQSALSTFSGSMTSAFSARASALASAWTATDLKARNQAIKDAWSTFGKAKTAARKSYNTATNAAWSQFSTARKTCKAPSTGENAGVDNM